MPIYTVHSYKIQIKYYHLNGYCRFVPFLSTYVGIIYIYIMHSDTYKNISIKMYIVDMRNLVLLQYTCGYYMHDAM